jgi:hypothetical protein
MPAPQSYKNHTRYDPLFHFTIVPLALIAFFGAIHLTIRDWPRHHGAQILWILLSLVAILIAGMARSSALRAQDRVIRLEERIRYAALLSAGELAAAEGLSLRQIIALRFASDTELPGLINRTLAENLAPKQIKESIVTWRPDNDRV